MTRTWRWGLLGFMTTFDQNRRIIYRGILVERKWNRTVFQSGRWHCRSRLVTAADFVPQSFQQTFWVQTGKLIQFCQQKFGPGAEVVDRSVEDIRVDKQQRIWQEIRKRFRSGIFTDNAFVRENPTSWIINQLLARDTTGIVQSCREFWRGPSQIFCNTLEW